MKYLFLFSILFFTSQENEKLPSDSSFGLGPSYKIERKFYISELIGNSDNHFFILKRKKKASDVMIIEKYNSNSLEKVNQKEFKLPLVKGERVGFKEVIIFGDKIVFILSQYIKFEHMSYAYALTLDFNLSELSEPKEIDQVEIKSARQSPGFQFILSKDEKKLLVEHNFPYEKYNNEKFSYIVYDTAFNVIWKKEIEMPYQDKLFKVNSYILDDSTNIHLLSQVSPEKRISDEQLKGVPNNSYSIISYFHNQNKIKELDINLNQKWVSSVTFDIAPDGDLIAAGFYSNSQYFSVAGTFYLRIDDTTRLIKAQGMKSFEKDFLREFLPEKKIKKGKELNDFYFDHFVIRDDGSALLVAEQYYMVTNYYWDPYLYTYNYTYQYYYNDIILVNILADGSIDWTKKIPKKQISSNDGGYYSSYAFGFNGKEASIIFNDHADNIEKYSKDVDDLKSMSRPWKSLAIQALINQKGEITYKGIFNASKDNLILRPKLFFQQDKSSLIIMGVKGSNYRFGNLKL